MSDEIAPNFGEDITQHLREELRKILKADGTPFTVISSRITGNVTYVSQMMSPPVTHNPKLSTLAKIAEAAGYEIQFSIVKKSS